MNVRGKLPVHEKHSNIGKSLSFYVMEAPNPAKFLPQALFAPNSLTSPVASAS